MLSIKSILDVLTYVDLVDNLIGILLESCSENDNLVVLSHCLNKLDATRTYKEETFRAIFYIVNKSLIEIKNKCISIITRLKRIQERRRDLRQVLEVVWENSLLCRSDR